jgi:muramoyltetrapeptide carboxypeptidase
MFWSSLKGVIEMKIIKPEKLKERDIVALIATSSYVKKSIVEETLRYLENTLHLRVILGKNIYKHYDYMAGTIAERLDDLHSAFVNPDVKAILIEIGGASSIQLLEKINYDLLKRNPKIIIGFSDSSILINAIHLKTGIIVFHGPDGARFNENMSDFSRDYFKRCIMCNVPMGRIQESQNWNVIRNGNAEGRLIGGNLNRLSLLLGTPYEPNWNGKILFWECVGEQYCNIDAMLMQLKLNGVFKKIKGMIIGDLFECHRGAFAYNEKDIEPFNDMILRNCCDCNFPILHNVKIGHTNDTMTIPIGIDARLNLNKKECEFQILECAVF